MRGLKDPCPWDPNWRPRLLSNEVCRAIWETSSTIFTKPLKVGPLPSKGVPAEGSHDTVRTSWSGLK